MFLITSGVDEGEGSAFGFSCELTDFITEFRCFEFVSVAGDKFAPAFGVVCELFSEFVAGSELLGPFV